MIKSVWLGNDQNVWLVIDQSVWLSNDEKRSQAMIKSVWLYVSAWGESQNYVER